MLSEERRRRILQIVEERGSIATDKLAEYLPVSKMTLWRDLRLMESAGRIRRVYGGVVRAGTSDPLDGSGHLEPPFLEKSIVNLDQKRRIARHAAENFIADGDVVILEGGTTAMQIVGMITRHEVTVVTHALNTLLEASKRAPALHVICAGGMLRVPSYTFVGPDAVDFFRRIKVNTLFLSGSAIDAHYGLSDPNPLEVEVKKAMIGAAERVIVCVDSSKIGQRSLQRVLPFAEMRTIITDDGARGAFLEAAADAGIDVRVV